MDQSEVKNLLPKVDHTPAVLDEPAQMLLKAADVIEKYGHAKSTLGHISVGFCINGALNFAATGTSTNQTTAGNSAKMRMMASLGGDQISWNNAPERTADEVVAKLRAVALGG